MIYLIARIINAIYPRKIRNIVTYLNNKYYTSLLSFELKYLGENTIIQKKIFLHGANCISIGNNCNLGYHGTLTAWAKHKSFDFTPEIVIEDNVSIGSEFHITSINSIIIESNVLMGKKVTITDNSHGILSHENIQIPPSERRLFSKGPVIIKKNVWIGDKVTILSNVTVGENSIIGANSVVNKDVSPNSLVAGNPAVLIKYII